MINVLKNLKFILVGFVFSNGAAACSSLPNDLISYMKSLDISYSPIDKKDLDPQILLAYKKAVVCIVDDFDGDGKTDYALLLKNQKTRVSVVVFLRRGTGFDHKVLSDTDYLHIFDPKKIQVIMIPASGKIEALEETIQLKNMGIQLSELYSPFSTVYFWKDSDFAQAPLSD